MKAWPSWHFGIGRTVHLRYLCLFVAQSGSCETIQNIQQSYTKICHLHGLWLLSSLAAVALRSYSCPLCISLLIEHGCSNSLTALLAMWCSGILPIRNNSCANMLVNSCAKKTTSLAYRNCLYCCGEYIIYQLFWSHVQILLFELWFVSPCAFCSIGHSLSCGFVLVINHDSTHLVAQLYEITLKHIIP